MKSNMNRVFGFGQSGAALVTSLIILLVLTLIAISGMRTTLMQDKMVGALRDADIALEAAEDGDRQAEAYLTGLTTMGDFNNTNGKYLNSNAPSAFTAATWTGTNSVVATKPSWAYESPRYFIEYIGEINLADDVTDIQQSGYSHDSGQGNVRGFRVVARGTGASGEAQRIIETYYGKRF